MSCGTRFLGACVVSCALAAPVALLGCALIALPSSGDRGEDAGLFFDTFAGSGSSEDGLTSPAPSPIPGDIGSAGLDLDDSVDIVSGEPTPDHPSETVAAPDPFEEFVPPDTLAPEDIQPGTLTAGSFDDNLNYDVFSQFVADSAQNEFADTLPPIALSRRVIVSVIDSAGEPVGDARVVVNEPGDVGQQLQPILNQTTGSDGRLLFMTELGDVTEDADFSVTVYPPDGGSPVVQSYSAADAEWEIRLPSFEARLPSQLDLAFVVDATGSMLDEIEFLKVEMDHIAGSVHDRFPEVHQRFALIVYRDDGDDYVTRSFDFTDDLSGFQENLIAQFASGGGDYPEAMHLALEEAADLSWRTQDTARVLFLVADAPPHVGFAQRTIDAVNALRSDTIAIYPVAASGVATEAELIMRTAALLTLSRYLFLTDDSGVGNSHAEPHIPCYHVELLDDLMIRMIASELVGQPLFSSQARAVRTVGNPVDGVCQADVQTIAQLGE